VKKFLDILAVLALGAAVVAWFGPGAPRRGRRIHPAARAPGPAAALPAADAEATTAPSEADERLRERLRARLARMARGPRAVDVEVRHGEVRLRGRVPAQDVDRLTSMVWSTPGVESIENRLAVER
jgi:hypothetical protein